MKSANLIENINVSETKIENNSKQKLTEIIDLLTLSWKKIKAAEHTQKDSLDKTTLELCNELERVFNPIAAHQDFGLDATDMTHLIAVVRVYLKDVLDNGVVNEIPAQEILKNQFINYLMIVCSLNKKFSNANTGLIDHFSELKYKQATALENRFHNFGFELLRLVRPFEKLTILAFENAPNFNSKNFLSTTNELFLHIFERIVCLIQANSTLVEKAVHNPQELQLFEEFLSSFSGNLICQYFDVIAEQGQESIKTNKLLTTYLLTLYKSLKKLATGTLLINIERNVLGLLRSNISQHVLLFSDKEVIEKFVNNNDPNALQDYVNNIIFQLCDTESKPEIDLYNFIDNLKPYDIQKFIKNYLPKLLQINSLIESSRIWKPWRYDKHYLKTLNQLELLQKLVKETQASNDFDKMTLRVLLLDLALQNFRYGNLALCTAQLVAAMFDLNPDCKLRTCSIIDTNKIILKDNEKGKALSQIDELIVNIFMYPCALSINKLMHTENVSKLVDALKKYILFEVSLDDGYALTYSILMSLMQKSMNTEILMDDASLLPLLVEMSQYLYNTSSFIPHIHIGISPAVYFQHMKDLQKFPSVGTTNTVKAFLFAHFPRFLDEYLTVKKKSGKQVKEIIKYYVAKNNFSSIVSEMGFQSVSYFLESLKSICKSEGFTSLYNQLDVNINAIRGNAKPVESKTEVIIKKKDKKKKSKPVKETNVSETVRSAEPVLTPEQIERNKEEAKKAELNQQINVLNLRFAKISISECETLCTSLQRSILSKDHCEAIKEKLEKIEMDLDLLKTTKLPAMQTLFDRLKNEKDETALATIREITLSLDAQEGKIKSINENLDKQSKAIEARKKQKIDKVDEVIHTLNNKKAQRRLQKIESENKEVSSEPRATVIKSSSTAIMTRLNVNIANLSTNNNTAQNDDKTSYSLSASEPHFTLRACKKAICHAFIQLGLIPHIYREETDTELKKNMLLFQIIRILDGLEHFTKNGGGRLEGNATKDIENVRHTIVHELPILTFKKVEQMSATLTMISLKDLRRKNISSSDLTTKELKAIESAIGFRVQDANILDKKIVITDLLTNDDSETENKNESKTVPIINLTNPAIMKKIEGEFIPFLERISAILTPHKDSTHFLDKYAHHIEALLAVVRVIGELKEQFKSTNLPDEIPYKNFMRFCREYRNQVSHIEATINYSEFIENLKQGIANFYLDVDNAYNDFNNDTNNNSQSLRKFN